MDDWFELKVEIAAEGKDAVSSRLFELGAQGVVEDTGYVSGYFPAVVKEEIHPQWVAYANSLMEMTPALGLRWAWFPVPEVNWVDKYKENFRPQRLTNLFYLQPAWDKDAAIPPEMIPIQMELGQAFGTGLHASTRLALHLVQTIANKFWEPEKISLLDVGTGTGILAIAAKKLGVGTVEAIDIDEVSVGVARENLAANGCESIELSVEPISALKTRYDVVVANILLDTHKQLQKEYARVCKPQGYLILSGFLSYQLKDYRRWLDLDEWRILEQSHLQDWGACLLGHKSRIPG